VALVESDPKNNAMKRLDFTLPAFTRMSWVSDVARETWEPRFAQITEAWAEVEWLAIAHGIYSCGIIASSSEQFIRQSGQWLKRGLAALPLSMQPDPSDNSSAHAQLGTRASIVFRFVIGKSEEVISFQNALESDDYDAIGNLLGYPRCCQEAIKQAWQQEGLLDTTWPMALRTTDAKHGEHCIELFTPPQTNMLWRWMNLRTIPYMPCRFDCQSSLDLADKLIQLAQETGYEKEMHWLLTILEWPVEWSALHGIAEIKTPVVKVSTTTDASAYKYVVLRKGNTYPEEGAQGLGFPFSVPNILKLTESRSFKRGLQNPIVTLPMIKETEHE